MRSQYRYSAALALLLGAPTTALAQAAPNCPAMVAPAAELARWAAPIDRAAVGDVQQLASADISVGQALHLTLLPQTAVAFPLLPGKPAPDGSHAGLLSLTIAQPGTYRVALGTGAWIDLVDNARVVASTAHAHGPVCSGIHKIVDFPLLPGRYTLQISANAEPRTTVLVVRVP